MRPAVYRPQTAWRIFHEPCYFEVLQFKLRQAKRYCMLSPHRQQVE